MPDEPAQNQLTANWLSPKLFHCWPSLGGTSVLVLLACFVLFVVYCFVCCLCTICGVKAIDKISSLSCQKVADSITSSKMGNNVANQASVVRRNIPEYIRRYLSAYCTI